jgi:indoleamine 2,3-dioxygenase
MTSGLDGAVDRERGFLPVCDPLQRLPDRFAIWDEVASDLPKLLPQERVRRKFHGETGAQSTIIPCMDAALRDAYDACVELVEAFRSTHLEYAARYIQKQAPVGANSTTYGTGARLLCGT